MRNMLRDIPKMSLILYSKMQFKSMSRKTDREKDRCANYKPSNKGCVFMLRNIL